MCHRGQQRTCSRNGECGSSHLGSPDDIRIPWRRVAVIQRGDTMRPSSLSQMWQPKVMYLKVDDCRLSTSQSGLLRHFKMWPLTSVGTSSTKAHTIYATAEFPLDSSAPLRCTLGHTLS